MFRRVLLLALGLAAFTSCALRPRYAELVNKDVSGPVVLQVVDRDSQLPIAGARIEVGEGRSQVKQTTDKDGVFTLPVDKRFFEENPVVVVSLPKGFSKYSVRAKPVEAPALPPPPVAPEVVGAPPPAEAFDAGT